VIRDSYLAGGLWGDFVVQKAIKGCVNVRKGVRWRKRASKSVKQEMSNIVFEERILRWHKPKQATLLRFISREN